MHEWEASVSIVVDPELFTGIPLGAPKTQRGFKELHIPPAVRLSPIENTREIMHIDLNNPHRMLTAPNAASPTDFDRINACRSLARQGQPILAGGEARGAQPPEQPPPNPAAPQRGAGRVHIHRKRSLSYETTREIMHIAKAIPNFQRANLLSKSAQRGA